MGAGVIRVGGLVGAGAPAAEADGLVGWAGSAGWGDDGQDLHTSMLASLRR